MKTYNDEQARASFVAGDYATAETQFRAATMQAPADATAHYNLGVTLAKMERFEEAMACYRAAIERNPGFGPAYTNFGFCLNGLGLIAQARQAFQIARTIDPQDTIAVLNEGIAALALGDYETGWKDFAARWQLPAYAKFKRTFAQPEWNGEDLGKKTIFLYAEQGFGDSLQMARFIPVLEARGAAVVVEAPSALVDLLRSVSGSAQVIAKGDEPPEFDTFCALMDVPRALGITLDHLSAQTPYLFAAPELIEHYANLLPRGTRRRVGLSWAGRSSHENDRNRSVPLSQCAPLLACDSCEWVSLQRVMSDADKVALAGMDIEDWGSGFADFSATAAAIMTLDLVITVDTAIAHLAGALGKPVWVLLPFYADWRWLTERTDSPWYPTAYLFRQQRRGAWGDVIAQVVNELT